VSSLFTKIEIFYSMFASLH